MVSNRDPIPSDNGVKPGHESAKNRLEFRKSF